jgi:hypothetical protein
VSHRPIVALSSMIHALQWEPSSDSSLTFAIHGFQREPSSDSSFVLRDSRIAM